MNRRGFLITAAAASTGAILALKPSNEGAPYSQYFADINTLLKTSGPAKPNLVVDLDIVDHNINELLNVIPPKAKYRIAVKSIPSPQFVSYVMEKANTNRLMVFHQPFLNHIADSLPNADVLLGKPMPVRAAECFYKTLPVNTKFNHEDQLQWLIDTPQRAVQYLSLAKALNLKMRLNLEIDVGLHRGGLTSYEQLDTILALIEANANHLQFSGFMGYDPQIVKFPEIVKTVEQAYIESQSIYQGFVEYIDKHYPHIDIEKLCLNGAGSPTIPVHDDRTILNDMTAGSCLVKPIQFDIPQLEEFKAAAFIATPVLKKLDGIRIPGLEGLSGLMSLWNPNRQQTFFIYGGKWKAEYFSPEGLIDNPIYGSSTNQIMVNSSHATSLDVDDFVFLRPVQSEFVFLQFGDLITLRKQTIFQTWDILHQESSQLT